MNAPSPPRPIGEIDMGIGPWEMGSQTGWHHDYCTACPDCESTKLGEPPDEEE